MEHNKLVYIASPYSGDVERNVAFAKAACRSANMVFMPHLQKNRPLCDNDRTCKGYFLDSSKESLRNSFISFSSSNEVLRARVPAALLPFSI